MPQTFGSNLWLLFHGHLLYLRHLVLTCNCSSMDTFYTIKHCDFCHKLITQMEFVVIHWSVNHTANITGNANYWVKIILICFKKKTVYFYFFNVAVLFCLETKISLRRSETPYVDHAGLKPIRNAPASVSCVQELKVNVTMLSWYFCLYIRTWAEIEIPPFFLTFPLFHPWS